MFQESPLYVASATSTCVRLAYEYSEDDCVAVIADNGPPQVHWLDSDSRTTVLVQRGDLLDPSWRWRAAREVVALHGNDLYYGEYHYKALDWLAQATVAWAYRSDATRLDERRSET